MRVIAGALAASLALTAAGAATSAPAHNYVSLGGYAFEAVAYWDAAAVTRAPDGAIDISVLYVARYRAPGMVRDEAAGDLRAETRRLRVWCGWRTYRRIDLTEADARAAGPAARLEPELVAHFPEFNTAEEHAVDDACAGGAPDGLATLDAVVADAEGRLTPGPPPLAIAPVERPGAARGFFEKSSQVRRLGEIDRSSDGAIVRYLDWSTVKHADQKAVAAVLTVTRPDAAGDLASVELEIVAVDCAGHLSSDRFRALWAGEAAGRRFKEYPLTWSPVAKGTPAAKVLAAICTGSEPPATLASVNDAVDAARGRWGLPAVVRVEATQPPPSPSLPNSTITRPVWTTRPELADLAAVYPERARRMEMEGRATISCRVTADGRPTDCTVVSEDPPDFGFGAAAVSLAGKFQMQPKAADGEPVAGGTIMIPIRFRLPTAN